MDAKMNINNLTIKQWYKYLGYKIRCIVFDFFFWNLCNVNKPVVMFATLFFYTDAEVRYLTDLLREVKMERVRAARNQI
jgi:hypothetical protein